jgi:CSLREA domain-containing protein
VPKLGLALLAAAALLALAPAAGAKTYTVTVRGDQAPGACTKAHCTLREAIRAANAHAGADKIVLPSRRTYNLVRPSTAEDGALDGDLDVTNDPLEIVHPGTGRATIDANGIDRVLEVFTGARTKLVRLKITGGDNASGVEADGGGIRTYASLTLVNCLVTRNHADGYGGGIQAVDGRLTVRRSVISRNVSDDSSGAIDVATDDGISIERSTITRNRAVFAGVSYMYGAGQSRIVDSTLSFNRSDTETGTVYFSEVAGTMTILRSTINGNVAATDGGGFSARNGQVQMVNTTIAGNRAGGNGGGLWALTPVELNAVTIARNVADTDGTGGEMGGGIYNVPQMVDTPVEIENSLVALNRLGDGARSDCAGDPVASLGHNLLTGLGPTGACTGFDDPTDRVRSNPKIGLLKANGGPTKTIALLANSPALNRARSSTAPGRDQRGVKRRDPDIGAYERRR